MKEWDKSKELISEGYRILDKEVAVTIPGPCMPAFSPDEDTGIGSPYGRGAKRFLDFFNSVFHKILLGPTGKTFPPFYSPYESTYGENPFYIPLQKLTTEEGGHLLSLATLEEIYKTPSNPVDISFPVVGRLYEKALSEAWHTYEKRLAENDKFALNLQKEINAFQQERPYLAVDADFYAPFSPQRHIFEAYLAYRAAQNEQAPSIADLEVKIPDSMVIAQPHLFIKEFTLGSPPDAFADYSRDWNFKVFNPDFLFNPDGSLGPAGQFMYKLFDAMFKTYKGGIRIDHYIGFVNPYLVSHQKGIPNGRLYSSPENPLLKKYTKHTTEAFAEITEKIILKAMRENNATVEQIYPEDLGNRPEQMNPVMDLCGLGHMLVSQFVDIWDPNHMYRLKNARPIDMAVLDTHDTPTTLEFYETMNQENRVRHAMQLAEDLRFYYSPSLSSPQALVRMKWGELLACPARRVQAFFTSLTGQPGRYNEPGNPKKWRLRCTPNFEKLYFENLIKGTAYNPLDAIALAIYARGDDFFTQHREFVDHLRRQEQALMTEIQNQI